MGFYTFDAYMSAYFGNHKAATVLQSSLFFIFLVPQKWKSRDLYFICNSDVGDNKSSDAGVSFYAFSQFSKYTVLSASVKLWASFIVV